MPSFWQNNSPTKIQSILMKNSNDYLPNIVNQTSHQGVIRKTSSKTLHQFLHSENHNKFSPKNKQIESIRQKHFKTKQSLRTINLKSSYKLIPKNKIQEAPIIQFSQALKKIQDIFNCECDFSYLENKGKLKKALISKTLIVRPNSVKNLLDSHSKISVKKQFDEIIRVFNKANIKSIESSENLDKDQSLRQSQKKRNFLFKSRSKDKNETKNQESLSQSDRLQLIKQSKVFQKAQKHLMLKSNTAKILYHHLACELYIQAGCLQQALNQLYYCEYYARKMDFDHYIVPCLILQSEIKQSLYQQDDSIRLLKTALEFSIVKKWKQLQLRVLEKISMVYYYRGNSYMAKYYKDLSQIGLHKSDADIYIKQYSKSQQLKALQAKLFSIPYDQMNKKKYNDNHELDISRDLFQEHQKMIHSQHEEVSSMLRNSKTSKIGIKLRKLIIQNCEKAQVRKYDSLHQSPQIVPRFVAFEYPIQNCSQIIKSHLSKSRSSLNFQIKNINFLKTFKFLKVLYKKLTNEIIQDNNQNDYFDKENLPSIKN